MGARCPVRVAAPCVPSGWSAVTGCGRPWGGADRPDGPFRVCQTVRREGSRPADADASGYAASASASGYAAVVSAGDGLVDLGLIE
ncbi:hypothetical protein [Bifidobacterium breve]|uniref:hypothetical protein n=1 Tax=Bifidobacterium breve TaxID=1685 RepID=UPI0012FEC203|nr:hypothetical protein [Bifidobacterium breve]UVT06872.1 hypothetical protein HPH06_05370 [Bifidobacterium breve]